MPVPILEVAFRDVPRDPALDDLIRRSAERLTEVAPHLMSCRVMVDHPHQHPKSGSGFRVRVDLRVAGGKEIVIRREPGQGEIFHDLEQVLLDVFRAARRSLREVSKRQRGAVKAHPTQEIRAVIVRLDEDHGFVETVPEGRQLYFHENSVVSDAFEDLQLGQGVAISEAMGDEGPQVTSLRVVDHRGHVLAET